MRVGCLQGQPAPNSSDIGVRERLLARFVGLGTASSGRDAIAEVRCRIGTSARLRARFSHNWGWGGCCDGAHCSFHSRPLRSGRLKSAFFNCCLKITFRTCLARRFRPLRRVLCRGHLDDLAPSAATSWISCIHDGRRDTWSWPSRWTRSQRKTASALEI